MRRRLYSLARERKAHARRAAPILGALLLIGALAACGESATIGGHGVTTIGSPTLIAAAVVTVPPGRTAAPSVVSPTPRALEQVPAATVTIAAVAQTATPTATPATTTPATTEPTPVVVAIGEGDPREGERIFTEMACVVCHGENLEGDIGPALAGRTIDDLPHNRIMSQVMEGGNGMPAFKTQLSDDEIAHVVAFIRSKA